MRRKAPVTKALLAIIAIVFAFEVLTARVRQRREN